MSLATGEIDGVAYRKTARNAPMLLIEIETDRAGTWPLCEEAIEGPYPAPGTKAVHRQQLAIYEHELASVQALVRTDAHEKLWEQALAAAPQASPREGHPSLGTQLTAAQKSLATAEASGHGVSQAASQVAQAKTAITREAIRRLCETPGMRDGMPPLLSAKVIRKAPPPPLAANIAANGNSELAAVLRALLEERDARGKTAKG